MARSAKIKKLFKQQKGYCYLCGGKMTLGKWYSNTATIEHVIPKSRCFSGYERKRKNLKAACRDCNAKKGSMTPDEYLCALPSPSLMGYK